MSKEEVKPHVQKLLQERYYLRDSEGVLLESTPYEMYARVARAVARAEVAYPQGVFTYSTVWEDAFYNLMADNKFLPNSPTLMNAGKDTGMLSACFVLPVEDSMEGIFDTLKMAGIIFKNAGGVGYSFSDLREKGALIKSTGQQSSGPIEFMKMYNQMTEAVKAGGGRRGASMGAMSVSHPDIKEFIEVKDDGVTLTNFNLSILITDEFMKAVKDDSFWRLESPSSGKNIDVVSAKKLWDSIVYHAWNTGEPGLVFIDSVNYDHPFTSDEYIIKNVNACAELGLLPYESCNLGSINLSRYVKNKTINYDMLKEDIPTMVRFLDNIIDINHYLFPEIEKATKHTRKLGLGVMGWADMLIKLEIPYDSDEAVYLAHSLMSFIYDEAYSTSERLGLERGNFPAWKDSKFYPDFPMRNACLFAIAPTGTLSRIAGCSSAIEPNFAWHIHHNLGELEYDELHWAFEKLLERKDSKSVRTLTHAEKDYSPPRYMVTAKNISPDWHLKHQEVFQKYIDQSISKSINLPNSATEKDVSDIFMWAWEHKLKGITVYRDGSRENQPLQEVASIKETQFKSLDEVSKNEADKIIDYSQYTHSTVETFKEYRKRPAIVFGPTYKVDTGKGKMYVTVNYSHEETEPVEIFVRMGHKATGTEHELAEWSGRLLSLLLKYNVPINDITRQSNKVLGDNSFFFDQRSFRSLPQLISYLVNMDFQTALEKMELEDGIIKFEAASELLEVVDKQIPSADTKEGELCYVCGTNSVIREGGCLVCTNCGDSHCG